MSITWAFLRRDWMRLASYRLALVRQLAGMVIFLLLVYLVGGALADSVRLKSQAQGYFSFILAGLAFTDIFLTGVRAFPGSIREGQLTGTLEALLLTPLRLPELVFASSMFPIIQSVFRLVTFTALAVFTFGYWHHTNALTAGLVFVPAFLVFMSLGLISAAFVILFKQDDPIISSYAGLNAILGGALIPVSSLPGFVQGFAQFMPLSYALSGLRLALDGAPPTAVLPQLVVLWIAFVILAVAARFAFAAALRRAKAEGSLVQY